MNLDPRMRDLCDLLVEVAVREIQRNPSGEKKSRPRASLARQGTTGGGDGNEYTTKAPTLRGAI